MPAGQDEHGHRRHAGRRVRREEAERQQRGETQVGALERAPAARAVEQAAGGAADGPGRQQHAAQRGAPCSPAKAGQRDLLAPKPNPAGSVTSMSVRTPRERSAPRAPWLPASGCGRQCREGGWATKASVPATPMPCARTSAAAGETSATTIAVISGPSVNSSSIATESSANAVGTRWSRPSSTSGQSARMRRRCWHVDTPPTTPDRREHGRRARRAR